MSNTVFCTKSKLAKSECLVCGNYCSFQTQQTRFFFFFPSLSTITVISVGGKTILSAYKALSLFWSDRINSNDMKISRFWVPHGMVSII